MTTRRALVVLALLAAPVAGVPEATASGASCHGRPATIVSDGGIVKGTEGPDVIVSTGYLDLRAGAGDDVVCASGKVDMIDAGSGNDLIDIRGNTDRYAQVTLGTGSDTFIGGPSGEMVWGGGQLGQSRDLAVDRIDTGGGADQVRSGDADSRDDDLIRTGPGDDLVEIGGFYAGAQLDLGEGRNQLTVGRPTAGSEPWSVDVSARTIQQGGVSWTWLGTAVSFLLVDDVADVTFAGSAADEEVILIGAGPRASVDLGDGDDAVRVSSHRAEGSTYTLGPGDDFLSISGYDFDGTAWGESLLLVDLQANRFDYAPGIAAPAATMSGVETVYASAERVRVDGSARSERIFASGCKVHVYGKAGADRLGRVNGGLGHCPAIRSRLVGGPGADTLLGSEKIDDVLLGGAGRDLADGQHGDDRCVAEVERDCER